MRAHSDCHQEFPLIRRFACHSPLKDFTVRIAGRYGWAGKNTERRML